MPARAEQPLLRELISIPALGSLRGQDIRQQADVEAVATRTRSVRGDPHLAGSDDAAGWLGMLRALDQVIRPTDESR